MTLAPRATYRLQLTPEQGFEDVATLCPSLAALGVSHLYLSPVLTAAQGSLHGYDVADPTTLNPDLGGEAAWRVLVDAARAVGLRVLVDLVPNHMTTDARRNRWWRDVLEDGLRSPYAAWFDVDWAPADPELTGRVLVPMLGGDLDAVGADLRLERDGGEVVLRYFEHEWPVALPSVTGELTAAGRRVGDAELEAIAADVSLLPEGRESAALRRHVRRRLHRRLERAGTASRSAASLDDELAAAAADPARLRALLADQHYLLAPWQQAGPRLNHRRFFTVASYVGVRMEEPGVFEATHARALELLSDGVVDGLRIDHIDGLRDPAAYLDKLARAGGGTWTVVEKILERDERLPAHWRCAGTTGYEAGALLAALSVSANGVAQLIALRDRVAGGMMPFARTVAAAKRELLATDLAADLDRTARACAQALPGVPMGPLRETVRELLVGMPVYRTYTVAAAGVSGADAHAIEAAIAAAHGGAADARLVDVVGGLLAGRGWDAQGRAREAVARFQQLAPAVMAKGLEDTALYRDTAVLALCDVGLAPDRPPASAADWHAWCAEAAAHPSAGLTATATHDSKRGEDVRARLCALTEVVDEWSAAVEHLRATTAGHRGDLLDGATELFAYQTAVAAWPIAGDRLVAYVVKAAREAGQRTRWSAPDAAYEADLEGFARGVVGGGPATEVVETMAGRLGPLGEAVMLSWVALRLLAPGVPDIYQGCELPALTLVDPDNRRRVDHHRRDTLLRAAHEAHVEELAARSAEGLPKLAVTVRALDLRRRRPELFAPGAAYLPLDADGAAAAHLVAFGRSAAHGGALGAVAVAARLRSTAGPAWQDTALTLPSGRWRDLVHGAEWTGGDRVALPRLLAHLPVALLEQVG